MESGQENVPAPPRRHRAVVAVLPRVLASPLSVDRVIRYVEHQPLGWRGPQRQTALRARPAATKRHTHESRPGPQMRIPSHVIPTAFGAHGIA